MSAGLTPMQSKLLSYLKEKQGAGVTPSYRMMVDALGLASVSSVSRLVTALSDRGFIERIPGHARAIRVLEAPIPFGALRSASDAALIAEVRRRGWRVS